ncbi:MAG: acyl-ACP--UDP-N-acetylglucosamine O-acyltransferase [Acidobacteriota bacterium]|nr:acyl-ACP--UDP-N-acetylglucosamine O-acyltransferase [Acidobacteriota bacterium]
MSGLIHPTAIVDPKAELAAGVRVGAHAIVGPGVVLGEDTEIGAAAQVMGPAVMGRENRVFALACVGFEPQDLKFGGETTRLEVGDRNAFREFCTVHRGTGKGGGVTTIGDDNLFMAYSHVAHDCHVGDRTIFSNGGTLAGHVEVQDDAVIGAFSAVHQFCRVGRHAYIGGYSVITQDALPFVKTVGHRPAVYGINTIGLERKGFDRETIARLAAALRVLVRGGLAPAHALEKMRAEHGGCPEVDELVAFVAASERGVIRIPPGSRRTRGGGGS